LEPRIFDCDKIFIDSKFFKFDWNDKNKFSEMLKQLETIKKKVKSVFYFDTTDSSGCIQNEVFDYVDLYFKSQILKNKDHYKKNFYGSRIYSDYFHKKFKVQDNLIMFQRPLTNSNLKKLKLSWNSSLANYSLKGKILMLGYKYLKNYDLLFLPKRKYIPSLTRPNLFLYKGNFKYERNTISWQRQQIYSKMKKSLDTRRVNLIKYYNVLKKSKVVISPFGWGEINYKDYEAFIYGNLLFKPDVSHIQTWPELFYKNKTYLQFKWDLSDFDKKIKNIRSNFEEYIHIAENGQKNYFKFLNNKSQDFVNRLIGICKE